MALTTNSQYRVVPVGGALHRCGGRTYPLLTQAPGMSARGPVSPPTDCVGHYANDLTEYLVTAADDGARRLASGGEIIARLAFYGGMDSCSGIRPRARECTSGVPAKLDHQTDRATAVARRDQTGLPRLVAYLLAAPGRTLRVEATSRCVGREGTAYMVVAAFVVLDELPLSSHGTLDRRALSASPSDRDASTGRVAPSYRDRMDVGAKLSGSAWLGADLPVRALSRPDQYPARRARGGGSTDLPAVPIRRVSYNGF